MTFLIRFERNLNRKSKFCSLRSQNFDVRFKNFQQDGQPSSPADDEPNDAESCDDAANHWVRKNSKNKLNNFA